MRLPTKQETYDVVFNTGVVSFFVGFVGIAINPFFALLAISGLFLMIMSLNAK